MRDIKILLMLLMAFFAIPTTGFSQTTQNLYEVADWKGFRKAVVVYTFDDHCANQFNIAVPLFDEYGFKLSIYPVPDWNPNWANIKSAAQKGHEIGSHTMSHPSLNTISIAQQEEEYSNSKNKINTEINLPGVDCNTIAYPNCITGDVQAVSKYFIAGRTCSGQIVAKTPGDYYNISSFVCGDQGTNDINTFKSHFASAMNANGWFVILIHGIDETSYSPISAELLRQTVKYLDANRGIFWVPTFRDAVLYSKERDAVSVSELSNTSTEITVEITDGLDNEVYNLPITLRCPLPSDWKNAIVTQNGATVESVISRVNGNLYIMFDAVPDGGLVAMTISDEEPEIYEGQENLVDIEDEPQIPGEFVGAVFDFESGNIDGWTLQNPGAGISITQEDKYNGDYALKMANGSGTNAWSVQAFTPVVNIIEGHSYNVSFWIKAVDGGGKGRISTVNANQLGNQYWADFNVGSAWEQIVYNNLTAGSNTLQLAFDMGYVADKIYYIDDIIIQDMTPSDDDDDDFVGPLAKDHSKFLGNIIANNIPDNFDEYWNQITPENAGKWGSVEGTRGTMNWASLDLAYDHAKNKEYPFKYHTFVWGQQEPSWLKNLSAAEQLAELREFMQTVAQRYTGIDFIDVVNEPLHAPSSMKEALGGNGSTGWDWVIKSFEFAREFFPNAKLHLNEYGIISSVNAANEYMSIITALKNKNLIDGIGIQCHEFNVNNVSVNTMNQVLDILGSSGLPVYVSELDINGNPVSEENQYTIYKEKFPVLWQHEAVAGVTLWGYITGRTWKEGTGIVEQNGKERKAMRWLKEYMASEESKVPNKFTGIDKINAEDNIVSVFYANNELQITTLYHNEIKKVALFDISGKLLLTKNNLSNYSITIPLHSAVPGVYICTVDTEYGKIHKKIMVN
jgi:endo-1,4-beta-xylanase